MPGSPGPAGSTHIQQRAREAGQEVLQPVNSAAQLLEAANTQYRALRAKATQAKPPVWTNLLTAVLVDPALVRNLRLRSWKNPDALDDVALKICLLQCKKCAT